MYSLDTGQIIFSITKLTKLLILHSYIYTAFSLRTSSINNNYINTEWTHLLHDTETYSLKRIDIISI